MQRSKQRPPASEPSAAEVPAEVAPAVKSAGARPRKAPITVPAPAEATVDLYGAHLPPQPEAPSENPPQAAVSLRTLAAMHPQLRAASGVHPKNDTPPQSPSKLPLPSATSRAPRSTPLPVEETPDLAPAGAWRPPIAPQPAPPSAPRASTRLSRWQGTSGALTLLRGWLAASAQPDAVVWASIAQATLALLGAFAFAGLALRGDQNALWTLAFTTLAGAPAGVAYALATRRTLAYLGALALVVSQIALFAWSFALIGPRPALLLLAPALVVVAIWMGGRALGGVFVAGLGALYAFVALTSAPIRTGGATLATLDLIAVLVGLAVTTAALIAVDRRVAAAHSRANASRAEAEQLTALAQAQRAQVEEEGAYLTATLAEALHGRGVVRFALEGPLAGLAEMIYAVATRLLTLRRDRDERVRLEGALAQVIRAVDDASVGTSAQWPHQTGTPVDTLTDRLRAPQSAWSQDLRDEFLPRDYFALPSAMNRPQSNIRYLFPHTPDDSFGV
jgi:hypothetical protein